MGPFAGRRMTRMGVVAPAAAFGMLLSLGLGAGERGTADEAKALLQKAVEHYKQVGRKQALEDFTEKKSPWVDRDLYVACGDTKNIIVANGAFPNLDGKPLGDSMWQAAAKGGIQTVEYRWYNPVSGKMERKVAFVEKVDADIRCSVGNYKGQ